MANIIVSSADICQLAVPFISIAAYMPQWIKIIRKKTSENISLSAWTLWVVSYLFSLFYAIVQLHLNNRDWALVVAATITLVAGLFTVGLVIRYRKK